MNKSELAKMTCEKVKLTKKECLGCIDAITELISQSVKNGEEVNILGFGRFKLKTRAAKKTYNPITKKYIKKPACKMPVFKVYKSFKEIVNA